MNTAQRIKALRKELHLSQEKFARDIGVSRATIASWEIGRRQPTISIVEHICEVFDRDIQTLLVEIQISRIFTLLKDVKLIFDSQNIAEEAKDDMYQQIIVLYQAHLQIMKGMR